MIDVVGFIELGGYYTSFMSGNTTQLGASFADLGNWLLPASLIGMFFIGSFLGTLIAGAKRGGPVGVFAFVLLGLACTFALQATGFSTAQAMLVLATAAGAQNAALPANGSARLGATFVTGSLFTAGQDLARAVQRTAPPLRWLQHLFVWLALLVGAVIGAAAYGAWQIWSLLLPGVVYALFLIGFAVRRPA